MPYKDKEKRRQAQLKYVHKKRGIDKPNLSIPLSNPVKPSKVSVAVPIIVQVVRPVKAQPVKPELDADGNIIPNYW